MQVLQDRETAGHKLVADKLAVGDRLPVGDSLVVVEDKLAVDRLVVERRQVAGGKLAVRAADIRQVAAAALAHQPEENSFEH